MALVLNEEQRLLQDSASDFFTNQMPISDLRILRDEKNSDGFSRTHWQEMVEMGWAGTNISEQYGGLDFGYSGLGLIMEQAGRTLAASPLFASCALGASALSLMGSDSQKSELLPQLASGEMLLALAIEEGASHGPEQTQTTAKAVGDQLIINGQKTFVLDGHIADQLIVVTRTAGSPGDENGLTAFLLSPKTNGITITRTFMADGRNASTVSFDNVKVSAGSALGSIGGAMEALQDVLSIGQILISAEIFGSLQQSFERTVDYIKQREQFDTILGSKQALQHRAAQMFTQIELCKSLVLSALSDLDNGLSGEALAKVASITKAKLSTVFLHISSEGVQMHGGIGMTDDEEIGFFLKRARTAEHILGDVRYHENRCADLMGL